VSRRTAKIKQSLQRSVCGAEVHEHPYPHWFLRGVFPLEIHAKLKDMPFPVGDLGGVSGTREAHNPDRVYFSGSNLADFKDCHAVAEAFQDKATVRLFQGAFGAELAGSFVRIEYAQDVDGFWLKPHTDIGVKLFTMVIYISDDPSHVGLGTDIYADVNRHVGRSPFKPNSAMVFIPSDRTWHGFKKRPIKGVRRSIIVNYVTNEWRAREQLAFPLEPARVI
jgi:hypothetical protein